VAALEKTGARTSFDTKFRRENRGLCLGAAQKRNLGRGSKFDDTCKNGDAIRS